jgi:hypothetical protein
MRHTARNIRRTLGAIGGLTATGGHESFVRGLAIPTVRAEAARQEKDAQWVMA